MTQLEEAKKRDHRVLGRQLRLFTITPQAAGQGLILWMPRGATLRYQLESFIREELLKRGYQPVYTPHIGNLNLYRTSGHFPYYADAQFPPMYMNPSVQTADLWLALLDQNTLSESEERNFVELFRAVASGDKTPEQGSDLPRYPLADLRADAAELVASLFRRDDSRRQEAVARAVARRSGGLPAQTHELPAPHPNL